MALSVNTEGLKKIASLHIESQLIQRLGAEVFNNVGSMTPEHRELCDAMGKSIEVAKEDLESLKDFLERR